MENPATLIHAGVQRGFARCLCSLCAAVSLLLAFAPRPALAADAKTNDPADVKISGFGFFGNREMLRLLKNFQPEAELPPVIGRTFVEDAALVLFSRAKSEGYLNARLHGRFTLTNGAREQIIWTNALDVTLPRTFAARKARLSMKKGERFYYETLDIDGLEAMPEKEARSYFVSGDTLMDLRANRVYSPELLKSSMAALTEALARKGYHNASVRTNKVERNEQTGAVLVQLQIDEGRPTVVRSVDVTVEGPQHDGFTNEWTLHPDKPYSQLWRQDLSRQLQEQQFARGFPDVAVELSVVRRETNAASIQMDMAARVTTGPRVRVGEVIFSGNERTHSSVLESRMTLEAGEVLNRLEAERSRRRLARLGVFESVRIDYEEVDDTTRNVIYNFQETKPLTLSVLAGYGSYELLRGGLEFQHRNVLGLAHNVRLRAVQSFKSTSGELQYTIPEILGENVNVFAKGSGLIREEVTFTREEFGGSVGVQKRFEPIATDVSVHYDYEFLTVSDFDTASTNATGLQNARAAAIVFDLNRDQRQTPLLPRTGLKLFSKFEFATAALGGNVDYQRVILGASQHWDVGGGRLLHLGLIHGNSFTFGGNDEDFPFNKRFFPGGQNSVRGFQDGEASPLDADGNQLGAETYSQANFEFEQLITRSWSVVVFFDAVGFAQDRGNYPWDEELYSVGGGIRWRSIIGPVRLEYGHNLNPREHDPAGTLHFSIGFPF